MWWVGVMRNPLTACDGDDHEKFFVDFTWVENEFRSNLQKAGGVEGEEGDKEGGNWACGGPLPDPTHKLQIVMKIMGLITPLDPKKEKEKKKRRRNHSFWRLNFSRKGKKEKEIEKEETTHFVDWISAGRENKKKKNKGLN